MEPDREIPGHFNGKLPKRTHCYAKGTDEQHWTVCNRPSRIGVKSGSSNQRKEARGFSQVNAGLVNPQRTPATAHCAYERSSSTPNLISF